MASVSYPAKVLARLRAWGRVAKSIGSGPTFNSALREMQDHLQRAPESWGDPLKDYHHLRLRLYRRYGQVLIVYDAVTVDLSRVLVRDVQLTPGSPLAELLG